jgi:plastocyanin
MKRLMLLAALSVLALVVFVPATVAQEEGGLEAVPVQNARSVGIGDNFFDPPDAAVEPGSTIT